MSKVDLFVHTSLPKIGHFTCILGGCPVSYTPLWFVCSEADKKEQGEGMGWKFGETYWDSRNEKFEGVQFEPLW